MEVTCFSPNEYQLQIFGFWKNLFEYLRYSLKKESMKNVMDEVFDFIVCLDQEVGIKSLSAFLFDSCNGMLESRSLFVQIGLVVGHMGAWNMFEKRSWGNWKMLLFILKRETVTVSKTGTNQGFSGHAFEIMYNLDCRLLCLGCSHWDLNWPGIMKRHEFSSSTISTLKWSGVSRGIKFCPRPYSPSFSGRTTSSLFRSENWSPEHNSGTKLSTYRIGIHSPLNIGKATPPMRNQLHWHGWGLHWHRLHVSSRKYESESLIVHTLWIIQSPFSQKGPKCNCAPCIPLPVVATIKPASSWL